MQNYLIYYSYLLIFRFLFYIQLAIDKKSLMYFQHFSITHIIILIVIPAVAWFLAFIKRRTIQIGKWISIVIGIIIGINELIWYGYVINRGWFTFPDFLPLDLCDIVLWLTVYTLFTNKQWSFNLIYYWGLAGTGMAVLTPDIAATFPSYLSIRFLFSHSCVVLSILYLLWSNALKPSKGSWKKAFLWINIYAVSIGIYNFIFNTNYFYLCRKPLSGSLLDYMGPWPVYILVGEVVGLILFVLLYLPYKKYFHSSNQ